MGVHKARRKLDFDGEKASNWVRTSSFSCHAPCDTLVLWLPSILHICSFWLSLCSYAVHHCNDDFGVE